jgi:imidazoleglycerol-phosphate dehydratase
MNTPSAGKPRQTMLQRKTRETDITLSLNLDGTGQAQADTGVGFFDHMLDHLARHGLFDVNVRAKGDLHVDSHHTVEDVALTLGAAIRQAIGEKRGISRYGWAAVPMEDALANVALDLSGRPAFVFNVRFPTPKIGEFDVELVGEALRSLANGAGMNLHVNVPYGTNSHHIAEAIFKALAKALRQAVTLDPRCVEIPSTKGVL